jgi:hypothetical protein
MRHSLEELAEVFNDYAPQGPKIRESVLNQLKIFPLELAQMPMGKALDRLEGEVKSAVAGECSDDYILNDRKEELDEHLVNLLVARYWFRYILYPHYRSFYKEKFGTMERWWFWNLYPEVLDEARRYLREEWMQRPGVNEALLIALLQGELIKLTGIWRQAESAIPWLTNLRKAFGCAAAAGGFAYFEQYISAGLLGLVGLGYLWGNLKEARLRRACAVIEESIDDVGTSNYDGEELARRLRNLEAKGLFVNTLIFSVLKACPAIPSEP